MLKPSLLIALLSLGTVLQGAQPTSKKQQSESCAPGPRYMRAAVRHIEAGGVGYNQGYSTLESFIASDPNQWCVMPFLDLRGHVFNNGKMAANAGIGARSMWGCRAYGINTYYDYRNTHHKGYNQVSLGLETLGELWDLRVNGYLPVGGKVSAPYNIDFGGFSGNSILVNRKFQYAMKGIDAEAGFHFGKTSDFDFYGAAGPYYFKGEMGKGAIGGKLRLAGYYKEYVALELTDSFDNVFHNNVQGQLTLTLPFGPKSKTQITGKNCPKTCAFTTTLANRMLQPVNRQEIVVVNTHTKKEAASNFVIFVDNQSHSAGTFESPYPTLADAQNNSKAGDIIYVFPGDGTATGMNSGFTFKDQQQLLSASVSQEVVTNLGTITIPQQTALSPILGNTSGPVITLANNNVISGFNINKSAATGVGIVNTTPITSPTIKNNLIITVSDSGIDLTDVSGTLLLSNNIISTSNYLNPAIQITNTNIHEADYVIEGNNLSEANALLGLSYTDSSSISTSITDNIFTNDEFAITITADNSSLLAEHIFNISSNDIYTQDVTDITITLNHYAQASINFNENNLSNSYDDGIDLTLSDNSICNFNLYNNQMKATYNCIYIVANDNSTFNMAASNNFFGGGDNSAIAIYPSGAAVTNVSVANNTLSAIDADTFYFYSTSSGSSALNIEKTNFYSSGYNSINCTSIGTGSVYTKINQNNFFIGDLHITNSSSGSVRSIVTKNDFIGAKAQVTNGDVGSLCLQFNYNTANPAQYSNGSNSYTIQNLAGGTLNLEPLKGNIGFFNLTDVTNVAPNTCKN